MDRSDSLNEGTHAEPAMTTTTETRSEVERKDEDVDVDASRCGATPCGAACHTDGSVPFTQDLGGLSGKNPASTCWACAAEACRSRADTKRKRSVDEVVVQEEKEDDEEEQAKEKARHQADHGNKGNEEAQRIPKRAKGETIPTGTWKTPANRDPRTTNVCSGIDERVRRVHFGFLYGCNCIWCKFPAVFGASNNDGSCANQRCRKPLPDHADDSSASEPYLAGSCGPTNYRYCSECATSDKMWCFECGQPVDPTTRRCAAAYVIAEREREAGAPDHREAAGDPVARLLVDTLASVGRDEFRTRQRSPWLRKRMASLSMTSMRGGDGERTDLTVQRTGSTEDLNLAPLRSRKGEESRSPSGSRQPTDG